MNTTEPTEMYAGDSISWTKTLAKYPASVWQAHYYFRNEVYAFDVDGVADGDAFIFAALSSITAGWVAGTYKWQLFVSLAANSLRQFISEGRTVVKADPSILQPIDGRTYNEQVLAAINQLIAGITPVEEYSIGGRSLRYRTITELLELRKEFSNLVAQERRGSAFAFGYVEFRQP